jgi:ATP diphosphatase
MSNGNSVTRRGRDADEFTRLVKVVCDLRQKCPWDREQTLGGASRHLLEEAYEVGDAIVDGDHADVAEELGDVIVQAVFAAVIASESNGRDLSKIFKAATQKLIRRHPHVYANAKASTPAQVMDQWDRIKEREKPDREKTRYKPKSSLAKTGRALPALMRAEKLGEKARRRGMDWRNARQVVHKVREELEEVERALAKGDQAAAAEEAGDMMLALANLPRFLGRDAEQTLRRGCEKFVARFGELERLAAAQKLKLKDLSAARVESLWRQAKRAVEGA